MVRRRFGHDGLNKSITQKAGVACRGLWCVWLERCTAVLLSFWSCRSLAS